MSATLAMGEKGQEKEKDMSIKEYSINVYIFFPSLGSKFSKTTFYPKSKSVLESCFSK